MVRPLVSTASQAHVAHERVSRTLMNNHAGVPGAARRLPDIPVAGAKGTRVPGGELGARNRPGPPGAPPGSVAARHPRRRRRDRAEWRRVAATVAHTTVRETGVPVSGDPLPPPIGLHHADLEGRPALGLGGPARAAVVATRARLVDLGPARPTLLENGRGRRPLSAGEERPRASSEARSAERMRNHRGRPLGLRSGVVMTLHPPKPSPHGTRLQTGAECASWLVPRGIDSDSRGSLWRCGRRTRRGRRHGAARRGAR